MKSSTDQRHLPARPTCWRSTPPSGRARRRGGRGFAVVASEVKDFWPTRPPKATEEIATNIASIQAATKVSVQAMQHVAATIQEIDQVTAAVAAAVERAGSDPGDFRNVQGPRPEPGTSRPAFPGSARRNADRAFGDRGPSSQRVWPRRPGSQPRDRGIPALGGAAAAGRNFGRGGANGPYARRETGEPPRAVAVACS